MLLTAIKELNEPRLPTIMGILAAKRKEIKVVTVADLGGDADLFGLNGSPTQVVEIFPPKPRGKGVIISGEDPVEAAKRIVQFLTKEGLITPGKG